MAQAEISLNIDDNRTFAVFLVEGKKSNFGYFFLNFVVCSTNLRIYIS